MTRPPLILLSAPRSGTNYLLDVWAACRPGSVVLGEILRKGIDTPKTLSALTGRTREDLVAISDRSRAELWDVTCAAAAAQGRPLAAKMFYHHAPQKSAIWRHLQATAQPLHLIRRNVLANFVSLLVAKDSGIWQVQGNGRQPAAPRPVHVDPAVYDIYLAKRRAWVEWTRTTFAGPLYREAFYEDLDSDPAHCAAVLQGLGLVDAVPAGAVPVRFNRQGHGDLSARVTNYAEVRHFDLPVDFDIPADPAAAFVPVPLVPRPGSGSR